MKKVTKLDGKKVLAAELQDAENLSKATHFSMHDCVTKANTPLPDLVSAVTVMQEVEREKRRVLVYGFTKKDYTHIAFGQVLLTPRTVRLFQEMYGCHDVGVQVA